MSTGAPVAVLPRPAAVPTYPSLRRRERAAFRALNEAFGALQLLDKAGCDAEAYLRVSALYRAACEEHTAACEVLRAWFDDPPPTPPAGPAAGRPRDLSEYELLQRDARGQAPILGEIVELPPPASYWDSLEGANALARQHEGDLLDLQDDGREPF